VSSSELFVPLVFVALAEERQGQYAELLQFVAAYEPGISMPNFLSLRELLTGAYIGNLTFVLVSVHTMYIYSQSAPLQLNS